MPTSPAHITDLTEAQRSRLETDSELRAAFEAGVAPFLPKPVGVCFSGMQSETWVPVQACFDNAERAVRFARRDRAVAA